MEEALIKRVLPHSLEAEQSVIGSMLMDREAVIAASEIVTGSDFYETPNIDRLASQGMLFTNAYAAAANSAPSRACFMTGDVYSASRSIYGQPTRSWRQG